MVKFSTVKLPIPSPSSQFRQGLGYKTPSSTPQNERGDVDLEPAKWTGVEEAILIHLMSKEVRKGNKNKSTLSMSAWINIEKGFYEKTGKKVIISQLKRKFSSLRIRYSDFNKLLKEPGFNWNPVLDHVTATDDVWDAYIKENKKARMFRIKGCPLYNELETIYGNSISGSQNVTESLQCSPNREFKCGTENESTKSSQSDSLKDIIDEQQQPHDIHLHQPVPPVDRIQVVCEPMNEFVQPSKNHFTEVLCIKGSNSSQDDLKSFSNDFSITSCVKCLETIQGVNSITYLKAVKMFKDVDWREMFMAMSTKRRMDWLGSL